MFLTDDEFAAVVRATPLIALDLIVENARGQILLGKRNNRPAQGYWFVPGGRVRKDETLAQAFARLSEAELGLRLPLSAGGFCGVWQHFYDDNFAGDDFSTHYVVLAFRLRLDGRQLTPPPQQHNAWRWFTPNELLVTDEVHANSRAYFAPNGGEAPLL